MVPTFQASSHSMEPNAKSWLENKNDLGAEQGERLKWTGSWERIVCRIDSWYERYNNNDCFYGAGRRGEGGAGKSRRYVTGLPPPATRVAESIACLRATSRAYNIWPRNDTLKCHKNDK